MNHIDTITFLRALITVGFVGTLAFAWNNHRQGKQAKQRLPVPSMPSPWSKFAQPQKLDTTSDSAPLAIDVNQSNEGATQIAELVFENERLRRERGALMMRANSSGIILPGRYDNKTNSFVFETFSNATCYSFPRALNRLADKESVEGLEK